MQSLRLKQVWLIMAGLIAIGSHGMATELTLEQIEQLALDNDAVLQAKLAQGEAFKEQAVADSTLPDPKLKLGAMSVPVDTFALDQEPMTQVQVGFLQMIPRGDTLQIKSQQALKSSEASLAEVDDRRRMLIAQVRAAYLELLYWLSAEEVVNKNYQLFEQLVNITQAQYQSGVQRQQDVLRAELEKGLLADKLDDIRANQRVSSAQLAKFTAQQNKEFTITRTNPSLPHVRLNDEISSMLMQHPRMRAEDAKVSRSQYGIELARQEYKPEWMVDVTYGFRDGYDPSGAERADFLSAMVVFDLPLFTADRQDRNVSASRLQHQSVLDSRQDILRDLTRQYEEQMANWNALRERMQRYEKLLVPQAHGNAAASLHAYQNRGSEFTVLMRARITELDTELNYLRLRTNYLKTQAMLLYLTGEQQ